MEKKIWGLVLVTLSLGTAWGSNIHQDAAQCRLSTTLNIVCSNNCRQCHVDAAPEIPLDIYVKGDAELCGKCHPQESIQGSGTQLLRLVSGGGGNHPVAILYSPEDAKTALIPSPTGPRLFTDEWGNNPKIQCSTCHDSMSSTVNLLRVNNRGSALCLSCHIK